MENAGGGTFRWAIFGTGSVARKFVLDLRSLKGRAVVSHVASRDPANATRFVRDLAPEAKASTYEDAAHAPDVDAIYIATPPALHKPHALMGIAAGKPVLVEKPFAQTGAEAREIAEAARAAHVFCMEAMWTRFQPLAGEIRSRIARGDLGEIRGFNAQFLAANTPDATQSLFNAGQGGGAMIHRGIYPLSMAQFWLGPIARTVALQRMGETRVDEDTVMVLEHGSGAISTVRSSLRSAGPDGAVIWGTKARLEIDGPIWRPNSARLFPVTASGKPATAPRKGEAFRESAAGLRLSRLLQRLRGGGSAISAPFAGNAYHYEAEAVMQAVAEGQGKDPRMALDDTIALMDLMDDVRASATNKTGATP
ncbi:MAG: Gfo/Idh/MocA family oxidoreductase [Pseudomonadota bacterium]